MPHVIHNAEDTCLINQPTQQAQGEAQPRPGDAVAASPTTAPNDDVEKCVVSANNADHVDTSPSAEVGMDHPDGGLKAWLVVFGSFCAMGAIYGLINTSAVFEAYFRTHQLSDYNHSEIGWIFSLYLFLVFFVGVQVGPLFDRFGPRWLVAAGTSCITASLMLLSVSKTYYQIMLTYSVLGGLEVSDSDESVLLGDSEPPSILGQLPNIYVNGQRSQSQRCTPPLTPMAEEPSPYVPSMEACQIDFTPEPQSPCRSSEARFRDRLEIGQIDSDIASSASLTASPSLPVFHPDRGVNPRDLMLDEPIVEKELNGSSVAKVEAYPSKDLPVLELCEEDVVMDDQPADGYFDEAFAAILEDRHSACMRTVEQERFDPVDSIARIRVPPLEFTIPPPLWEQHTQGSRQMFEWVLNDAAWLQSAHFRPMPKDFDSMLKWAPFAPTAGRVSTTGSVDIPEDVLGQLLETKPPLVSSRSHVRQGCALRVAHLGSEDDIEAPPESGPTKSAVGAPRVSPHFRTQQRSDSLKPEATSSKGLDDLVKAAASKRKASVLDCTAIDNQNLLPFSSDSKATSRLLSGFMELRGRQTSSRDSEHGPSVRTDRNTPREVGLPVPAVKSNNKSSKSPTPALAPEFTIPAKKRTYIFSLALPRAVLRHIGRVWPKEHLVDRDYSHRSTLAWSPGSARRKEVTLSPAHEADISLTPTTGLIVTTLLKAKQQSLPNAKALPQLRERVLEVSQKYESLIILVSEGNTAGEYANDLPSSDMEAYAEFVRFASVLQAGVTVQLVPGAEGTLAKWVLKFMCEHSPRDREVPMFIQTQETSWEIFFRRGGMNVLAAQVMAGVLHQRKGDQGLADFKDMSVEQRIAMYGSFLGGPKLLANFSNMLDQSWE